MKTTHKLNIVVKVTYDDWNENPKKILKKDLISKVRNFIETYYPMKQTSSGDNSEELEIKLDSIESVKYNK